MPDAQRLFFALRPGPEVRAALVRAIPSPGPGGRLVPAENLHITLAFLGSVDEARVPELRQLAEAVQGCSFALTLARIEIWNRALVSVVPTHSPIALDEVVADLTARLARAGFHTEERAYRPHVTVIRERHRGDGRRKALIEPDVTVDRLDHPIEWIVNDFVLMRSLSGPGGSRYETLARWPLIDAALAV